MGGYIRGLDRLASKLNKLMPAMEQAAIEAAAQGLEDIKQDAQQLAPEDSGALRKSIRVEMQGNTGKVIVGVDYAACVEMGTSDTAAQPFLYPAYMANRDEIKQDIISGARAAIKEVGK